MGSEPVDALAHLAINVGYLPSQHHTPHLAFDFHTLEGCPLGLGELHGLRDNPLLLQVHLRDTNRGQTEHSRHFEIKLRNKRLYDSSMTISHYCPIQPIP